MFLRYEYTNCRGVLLKIIKVQFTYVLVHKARFLTGCTASILYIAVFEYPKLESYNTPP